MSRDSGQRIVLVQHPFGAPGPADFRLEAFELPPLMDGEVRLRTLYLAIDPGLREQLGEEPPQSRAINLGERIPAMAICRVEQSRASGFTAGDTVLAAVGWQDRTVLPAAGLRRIEPVNGSLTVWLGPLGVPGKAACVGLLEIGQARAGQTVAVAAATGAVGAVVGQIARLKGCRVIGIAGGPEKCAYAVEQLGFDACIDHQRDDFRDRLTAASPAGIDLYFESVGGHVLVEVLPRLNRGACIAVCGLMAWANQTGLPRGVDSLLLLMHAIRQRQLRVQGFDVRSDAEHRPAFEQDLRGWLAQGQIRLREDVIDGLASAPAAFAGLLRGDNFGQLLIRVAADEPASRPSAEG